MNRSYKNMFSKTLEMEFTFYPDTGEIFFQDGTRYSQDEWIRLKGKSSEEIRNAHTVKKTFDGEISGVF